MQETYTEQELQQVEAIFDKAEHQAKKALAWQECLNDYCAHVLHYHGQKQREDIETYWSMDRYDIAYGHGDHGFIGKAQVLDYFAGMNEKMRDAKLRYFSGKFPDRIAYSPEYIGVGDYCIHAIFTPHIQVAEDLRTATAFLQSPAICSELDLACKQAPMIEWGGYGATFVRDDAGWKIWQIRGYSDYGLGMEGWMIDHTDRPDPPYPTVAEQLRAEKGLSSLIPDPDFTVTDRGPLTRYRIAAVEPEMQAPYETWDDSISYIRDYPVVGQPEEGDKL